MPKHQQATTSSLTHPADFYSMRTSGQERYVAFNVEAFKELAAQGVEPGHGKVTNITKFAEGGFNRVFLLTMEDGFQAIARFVNIEKQFFDLPFSSICSVYLKHDLPSHLQASLYSEDHKPDDVERFCIGLIADYMFPYGKRAGIDIYRSPWKDPKDYLRFIAEKEIESTRKYGKPLELDFSHNGPFPGKYDPKEYIALLEKYLALVPYLLLPKYGLNPLNQPTLRHPDLSPNNIFVSPETGAISCIIDWQHTTVEPRLLVAGYPRAFETPANDEPSDLDEPKLPSEYDSLSIGKKAEADELYCRQTLFQYYRIFNGVLNKSHLHALRDPLLHARKHLIDRAGRQWSGNLITLMGALVRMTEYWSLLPDTKGIQCPVKSMSDELKTFHEHEEIWFALNADVNQWHDQKGVKKDALKGAKQAKDHLAEEMEGDEEDIALLNKGWLFRDHDE